MRRSRPLVLSAAGSLLLACTDATAPADPALVGHWATIPEDLRPSGWYQHHFTFTANGTFTSEVRSFGVYSGQRGEQLSAYSRTLGTFDIEGDRLDLRPTRGVWWDSFYGADSPEHEVRPTAGGGGPDDDMRYEVVGGRLILRYLTYPADAPVPTTRIYFRQR